MRYGFYVQRVLAFEIEDSDKCAKVLSDNGIRMAKGGCGVFTIRTTTECIEASVGGTTSSEG